MVRMLVLPKVLWGAAWVRVPAKKIWDLRLMIERCVRRKWGSINSRSKMLIWETSLGCDVCPYFYAASRAVMLEQRRLSRELAGHEKMTITGKGNPMNQVCKKWNWTHLEGARYQTRDGVLNLAMDGKATIKSICRRAWVDWLWLGESRVQRSANQEQELEGKEPLTTAHRKWNTQPPRAEGVRNERIGWMYAPCGKWKGRENSLCRCMQPTPDRAHWAWECTWTNGGRPTTERAAPRNEGERRMAIPLVERPRRGWDERNFDAINGLREAADREHREKGRVVIATDGGAMGDAWDERVGAFGVAVGTSVPETT